MTGTLVSTPRPLRSGGAAHCVAQMPLTPTFRVPPRRFFAVLTGRPASTWLESLTVRPAQNVCPDVC